MSTAVSPASSRPENRDGQIPGMSAPRGLRRFGPAILFALLVVLVYSDVVFQRRNFGGRDLLAYNLPMEKVTHDAYAHGELPVWNPFVSGGRPHLPNPNAGALYPLRILLSPFSFPVAMRIFPLLHWALAGIGVLALLRSFELSREAAWVGAVTYTFSGVVVSYVFYTHILAGMALFPWILWIVADRHLRPLPRYAALSFVLALDLLAADVFTVGLAILCSLLWIVLEEDASRRWRAVGSLFAAFGLACLAAAPQIAATALWVGDTNRAVRGIRLGSAFLFSIPWPRLFELVVPFPFGANWSAEDARVWGWHLFHDRMTGLFNSLYAGALAVIALSSWRRLDGRGSRFARSLFLTGLILTIPPSLMPASWADAQSPLPLRNPEKFALALVLALALLSGLFFDRLRRSSATVPRWPLAVAAVLAGLAGAAALYPGYAGRVAALLLGDRRFWRIAAQEIPRALTEGGLLWITTVIALAGSGAASRWRRAGSLLLLTFVPIAANRKIAQTFREEEIFAPTAFAHQLARWDPQGEYRTLSHPGVSRLARLISSSDPGLIEIDRRSWDEQEHVLWKRGAVLTPDFDVGDFLRMEGLRRWLSYPANSPARSALFESLSLRWGIRFRDQSPQEGFHPIKGDSIQFWDQQEKAFPSIRLAEKYREANGPVNALQSMGALEPGEIVIETGASRRGVSPPGRIRVLKSKANRLQIRVASPEAAWLFVLRGFWRHRTVLLDGAPVETVPAQLAFTALRVPPGEHQVDWRERVPGAGFSMWGPLLFLLSIGWLLFRIRLERRARSAS